MSVIKILQHDENIYDVDKKERLKLVKPPMYHSKFKEQVKLERKMCKFDHKTFGYPEVPIEPPHKFLKKNGGIKNVKPKSARECCGPAKKPPVPRRNADGACTNASTTTAPAAGQTNECTCGAPNTNNKAGGDCAADGKGAANKKDFKIENIKRVISAEPRRPKPRFVDTKKGDICELERSGLMPMHIYSPKFGKLPQYLVKRMRDAANQENVLRDEQARVQPKYRYITQEERGELLTNLKINWQEIQKEYQGLPILTDTIPKKLRKTKIENTLKQLERDIVFIETRPYIYVYNE